MLQHIQSQETMAGDTRKKHETPHSDLHGAAAMLVLQLLSLLPSLSNPSHCYSNPRASQLNSLLDWNLLALVLSSVWLLATAVFERTTFYLNNRHRFLCTVLAVVGAVDGLQVSKTPCAAWRNTLLECLLPGLVNPLAHGDSGPSLLVRLVSQFVSFCVVVFLTGGAVLGLTTVPILISALVSGGLLVAHKDSFWLQGNDCPDAIGDDSEGNSSATVAALRGVETKLGGSGSKGNLELPPTPMDNADKSWNQERHNTSRIQGVELASKKTSETWGLKPASLEAGPLSLKSGAGTLKEGGYNVGGGEKGSGTTPEERWDVSAAFGGSGSSRRAKKGHRVKKSVEEKVRRRAPAEVAIVMGAEVSRLVSVSKVMEIDDAQEFLVRAQLIMTDTAVRALQENAQNDPRIAKPMSFTDEMALETAARASAAFGAPMVSESGRFASAPGSRDVSPFASAEMSGSDDVVSQGIDEESRPVHTSLYERAERCVNRLGYEWAALKWEESQVEVRALGALKEAVLGRRAEDDVMRAVNLVRDARRGLAMLATASSRLEPWHALERRGCRAGLLFGPLWVTPLLAKDAGRAAWVAQACGTEGLVGESVNRVFPQLGMGQARALAAVCRDMERVESQLDAEFSKLQTAIRPWLRGAPVDPPSMTGTVIGNLGDEVERLTLQADALQLQLFQQCTQLLTPLQLATLLLALMDQRMRLQRLGSFWESVAAGQDVMTGVRKLTGRMANFNA